MHGQSDETAEVAAIAASFGGAATIPQMLTPQPQNRASPVDLDLDLDFSANDEPLKANVAAPTALPDFALPSSSAVMSVPVAAMPIEPTVVKPVIDSPPLKDLGMDFDNEPTVAFNSPATAAIAREEFKPADSGMLEFDMSSLSLELDAPITESPALAKPVNLAAAVLQGPLETKFALAEEFRALGDSDGARTLANEVIAQGDGALRIKAQALLDALS